MSNYLVTVWIKVEGAATAVEAARKARKEIESAPQKFLTQRDVTKGQTNDGWDAKGVVILA